MHTYKGKGAMAKRRSTWPPSMPIQRGRNERLSYWTQAGRGRQFRAASMGPGAGGPPPGMGAVMPPEEMVGPGPEMPMGPAVLAATRSWL